MNLKNLEKLLWLLKNSKKAFRIEAISSNNSVKLIEREENANYEFKVTGVSSGTLVIKCPSDQRRFFDPDKKDYTKICDYLIFIPNNRKITVIFCELKSKREENEMRKGGQQIKSTIPLLQYIIAGIKAHFGDEWEVEMHYTIIVNEDIDTDAEINIGMNKGEILLKDIKKIYLYNDMNINIIAGAAAAPMTALI